MLILNVQINFVQSARWLSLLKLHGKCQRAENRYAQLHGDSQSAENRYAQLHGDSQSAENRYAQLHGKCQRADTRLHAKKYTKMMLTCIIDI